MECALGRAAERLQVAQPAGNYGGEDEFAVSRQAGGSGASSRRPFGGAECWADVASEPASSDGCSPNFALAGKPGLRPTGRVGDEHRIFDWVRDYVPRASAACRCI